MQYYGNWVIDYKSKDDIENILTDAGLYGVEIIETHYDHHWIGIGSKNT